MNGKVKSGLKARPWLEAFVEDGDETLEPARERWRQAVDEAYRELDRLGIEVFERMRTAGGLETTALIVSEREAR